MESFPVSAEALQDVRYMSSEARLSEPKLLYLVHATASILVNRRCSIHFALHLARATCRIYSLPYLHKRETRMAENEIAMLGTCFSEHLLMPHRQGRS